VTAISSGRGLRVAREAWPAFTARSSESARNALVRRRVGAIELEAGRLPSALAMRRAVPAFSGGGANL
jgi:hypothetical protein